MWYSLKKLSKARVNSSLYFLVLSNKMIAITKMIRCNLGGTWCEADGYVWAKFGGQKKYAYHNIPKHLELTFASILIILY